MMRKTLAILLFAVCPSLSAQMPYLVKDINTVIPVYLETSNPDAFMRNGSRVYFRASTLREGLELWSTDETAAGTNLVADLLPENVGSGATPFAVVNGVFLFTALDVDHGFELWTTGGTAGGTHLFKDINPGPSSAYASDPFLHGNRLLFVADDGINGRELWISDGTPAGTHLVKDLNSDSADSSPTDFAQMNGVVYFSAAGGLWRTDGTDAGTMKVAGGVAARHLAAAGNRLFFEGLDANGSELWTSDGTESGTRMVTEIRPGKEDAFFSSNPGFAVLGDRVVFAAYDGFHREVWGSDGTAAGTIRLLQAVPEVTNARSLYDFGSWAVVGGRAFFCARDVEHGAELWSSDGTSAGTALFADLNPGKESSYPRGFVSSGGKAFFGSIGLHNEWGVWVSDGTFAGTRLVVGADASAPLIYAEKKFWPVGGKVFFGGSDVLHGVEPWVSDGTDSGTRIIANLAGEDVPSSYPGGLTAVGNLLLFSAIENAVATSSHNPGSLWRSDGTEAGTFKLLEGTPQLLAAGPWALFEQSGPVRWWRSDGTAEGTRAADDFAKFFGGHYSIQVAPIGETIFVSVFDYKPDVRSLWKTTAAPGAPAIKLADRTLSKVTEIAGRYFFHSEATAAGFWGLWTTDGTPGGTHAIVPQLLAPYGGVEVSRLVNAGGTIYFLLRPNYGSDMMLYRSDGTFAGTTVLKTVPRTSHDLGLTAVGRKVFFASDRSLWVSDGTESGTIELGKFDWSYSNGPMAAGDRVVFDPWDYGKGSVLWSSDGTPEGTRTLRKSTDLRSAASIDGTIYFVGKDAEHGEEPWTTDGTPEGTTMLVDLNPGPASSSPFQFKKSGDLLYFGARTEDAGRELWAMPLPGPRLSISDVRVAEGGPTQFTISLTSPAKQSVTVDYATSDGTARAGADYDAAAGTLTFAPGETTKSVEVGVRGDLVDEGNEDFFVTLRNPSGATIAKREGFAVIENDNQSVDLSLAPDFTDGTFDLVTVSNNGPRAATDVVVSVTMTPPSMGGLCSVCTLPPLSPGALASIATASSGAEATYVSAKVSARQPDSRPGDNAAGWVVSGKRLMAMNRLFLNPGDVAQVTIANRGQSPVALRSSDPSVVSVGAEVNFPSAAVKSVTFSIGAEKAGTASIIADQFQDALPIIVTEFPTTPRWPGGVTIEREGPSASRFDSPIIFLAKPAGTAPFTGATATGTITVSAAGHEVARQPLGAASVTTLRLFPSAVGTIRYDVTYSGDTNFAPQTLSADQFVSPGFVTLTGSLDRVAGAADTFVLRVHAKGSPTVPPTGTIAVMNGTTLLATLPLATGGDESTASATLSNLPASPALTLQYSGDAFHAPSTQEIRVVERRRSVGR
jgi:ELWxxDGT repeat protein